MATTRNARTGQPRDGSGRYVRTLAGVERDAEAARQRARGRTLQQIADDLGYHDRAAVHRAVAKVLEETVAPARTEARKALLERLDEMAAEALAVLDRDHVTVSNGKVVRLAGRPVPDDAPVLAAIDRLLKIEERRSKLLGLDEPTQVESSVHVDTTPEVAALLERARAAREAGA